MLVEIDDRDIANARRGVDGLRALIRTVPGEAKTITVQTGGGQVTLELDALRSVADVVESVHEHPGRIADPDEEVSPREAAEILHISRPSVMRLVDKGHLRARKVNTHHRLSKAEVLSYRQRQASVRRESLTAIAKISEEFDF